MPSINASISLDERRVGAGPREGRRVRILVVDDAREAREGLARLVGRWGYEVEAAASAEEALILVERYRPDVVITDLVLPGMNGLSLLRRVREAARPPVVLLLTGHASVETAVEAMRQGAVDVLEKPFDGAQLRARLQQAVEQALAETEYNRRRAAAALGLRTLYRKLARYGIRPHAPDATLTTAGPGIRDSSLSSNPAQR